MGATVKFPVRQPVTVSFHTIDLKLSDIDQLFNTFDPAPFHDRELDREAEGYLIRALGGVKNSIPIKLAITLPKHRREDLREEQIVQAIRSHFEFRANQVRLDLKELFRNGRVSLVVGLCVLSSCLIIIKYTSLTTPTSPVEMLFQQSLLLLGWVANWRPLEIFLYDWWPIRRNIELLRRLAGAEIDIKILDVAGNG